MDDQENDPDIAFDTLMSEALDLLDEADGRHKLLEEVVGGYLSGSLPTEPHPLAPLSIEDVLCLPEFGGTFTAKPEFRKPGEHVNDNMLRSAVKSGRLTPLPLPARKLLFSRQSIQELLQQPCPDQPSLPASPSARPAATAKARSSTKPAERSSTTAGESARDAALRIAAELKKR